MRIAVCIAAVVLAGCISGPLAAQTAADVASDQELLAAYCLGREQQGLKDWSLLDIASKSVLPNGEKDRALLDLADGRDDMSESEREPALMEVAEPDNCLGEAALPHPGGKCRRVIKLSPRRIQCIRL